MAKKNKTIPPTVLVLFGATGDLVAKKIVPALFHLFENGNLPPRLKIIGFSRRDFSNKEIREYFKEVLKKHKDIRSKRKLISSFLSKFSYVAGNFNSKKDFIKLRKYITDIDVRWRLCSNKLYYLAVPPKYYDSILNNLADHKLTEACSPDEGWTRVIIEKPFGKDFDSAKKLDELLGKLFKDEQVYPIDHYLGKEMVENILTFRFANNLFEKNWDNKLIERIDVRVYEKFGVKGRGKFYDGIGALRDVGQNHILQMLALVTMSNPGDFTPANIRARRTEILSTLHQPSVPNVKKTCYRAQYKGYTREKDVDSNSKTETYFKINAQLDAPQWEGVPIILEHGKMMPENKKEIIVHFRHPDPCYCPPGVHLRNKIIIRIEPEEKIFIHFWANKPGLTTEVEERVFTFDLHSHKENIKHVGEYERLLHDCIIGDQTLFTNAATAKAMWRFIDPIIRSWQKNNVTLNYYQPGSRKVLADSDEVIGTMTAQSALKKEIGIIGLGKMGIGLARQLISKGWRVVGYNRSPGKVASMEKEGMIGAYSIPELVSKLGKNKLVWMMVPAGKPVDLTLFSMQGLMKFLKKGDTIIDGGNSNYKNTIKRAKKITQKGVSFLDAGVSGGPKGARYGASMMIGGKKRDFKKFEKLFLDLNVENGYAFFPGHGAGHFVKMVHNGIEYGMMQSIAEGFDIMEKSKFKLDLHKVARVYSYGTVIESRLISLMRKAFEDFGNNLKGVSGAAQESGEGAWTVEAAHELNVPDKVLHEALRARRRSRKKPSFQGKLISALRFQFGGHDFKEGKKR